MNSPSRAPKRLRHDLPQEAEHARCKGIPVPLSTELRNLQRFCRTKADFDLFIELLAWKKASPENEAAICVAVISKDMKDLERAKNTLEKRMTLGFVFLDGDMTAPGDFIAFSTVPWSHPLVMEGERAVLVLDKMA